MKRLLFTAGGSPGQEGIYRYLKKKYELYFVDSDISNIDPIIPSTNKRQIPLATDINFLPFLKNHKYLCSLRYYLHHESRT